MITNQNQDGEGSALPTALAIGLNKTRGVVDSAPLTTEVFASLRNSKPFPKQAVLGFAVNRDTVDAVAFMVGFVVPDDELAKLKELQAQMSSIHDRMADFSPGNVNAAVFKARDEMHAAAKEGKDVGSMTVPSREQVQQTYTVRRTALLEQLKSLTQTAVVPLCKPILERFEQALEESLRGIESGEKETLAAYSLPYEPSRFYKAFVAVAAAYTTRRLPLAHEWRTPQHLLEGIVTL